MPRIDLTKARDYWGYGCPDCESSDWRANNGSFGCRACGAKSGGLVDLSTGEYIPRSEIEFVGTHASWKAPYSAGGDA